MHKRSFGNGYFALFMQSYRAFNRHDMSVYAAALAYHVLFSLFPFVIFLIALLSFFEMSAFFDWLREQAAVFLPKVAMEQVDAVIRELQVPQSGLLSTGVVAALWLASRGIRAMMTALNVAYGAREQRPAWKRYPLSVLYTVGLAVMLSAAAAMMIIGPQVLQWLSRQFGLESFFVTLWTWLRWPAALVLLVLALAVVYYAGPNVRHKFKLISPGSVVSVIVWVIASLGFGYYVQNFGNYNVMYGSIGAVIVLLLYIYLSSAVVLYGAEVNAAVEGRAAPG